jgi:hypothetical protein
VRASTADFEIAFDYSNAAMILRSHHRSTFSSGAAANHENVELLHRCDHLLDFDNCEFARSNL